MEDSRRLIRISIYNFLKNYQIFTSIAAVLAFPYAISVLLPEPSSSFLHFTFDHLNTLFHAAAFPIPSNLIHKLSQSINSSLFSLPFSLTFLIISKSYVIQVLNQQKPILNPSFSSIKPLYNPLFQTHLCNSLIFISTNATMFFFMFLTLNFLNGFGLNSKNLTFFVSFCGFFLYSMAIAKSIIICNLALVLSAMEMKGGFMAIVKACVLIRGRTGTALLVSMPFNVGMAAIDALFHYRVVRGYHLRGRLGVSLVLEGMFVAYLYSVFVVLDSIVSTLFFKSCRVHEDDGCHFKGFDELP